MAHGHGGARPGAGRKPKSESNQVNSNRVSFTNKQLSELLGSPFVAYISRKTITFTEEFKNIFWKRYLDGDNSEQVFFDCGLNPLIIGKTRIKGLIDALRRQHARGLKFSDGKELNPDRLEEKFDFPPVPRRPKFVEPEYTTTDVKQMQQRLTYLEQELEFVKKIVLAGTGARRT